MMLWFSKWFSKEIRQVIVRFNIDKFKVALFIFFTGIMILNINVFRTVVYSGIPDKFICTIFIGAKDGVNFLSQIRKSILSPHQLFRSERKCHILCFSS
jgi:hypothetical protein